MVAAWAGVLCGVWAALSGAAGTAKAPPLDSALALPSPEGLQAPLAIASSRPRHPDLAGLELGPWRDRAGRETTDGEGSPLVWAVLSGPDARRITLVRIAVDHAEAALWPSARWASELPGVEQALAARPIDTTRLVATIDLGTPRAAGAFGASRGTRAAELPLLTLEGGKPRVRERPEGDWIQGGPPVAAGATAAVAEGAAGELLIVHAVAVAPEALAVLLAHLGAKRAAWFGGVGEVAGSLYISSAATKDADLLRREMRTGARSEPANAMALDRFRLILYERQPR